MFVDKVGRTYQKVIKDNKADINSQNKMDVEWQKEEEAIKGT